MPIQPTKTARIEARLTPESLAAVRRAAAIEGRSLSDFVVSAAEKAARRTINAAHVISLNAEDQRRFVEALLEPPPPTDAMERAHRHRRRLIHEP